ncbi:MAG: hypothetical protein AAGI63_04330 [Planctomycetota bacterium]
MCRYSLVFGWILLVACSAHPVFGEDESDAPATSVWVTSIAQLGSSDRFVAATADGLLLREATVYSFPAANPTVLEPLYKHPAAVWCVVSTSDGSHVASVDYRGNLIVFNPSNSEIKTHEKGLERWCQSMIVTPDDQALIAGNEAGKVMMWDLEEAKVSKSVELDGHAVTGLAISPDGSQLAASDGGGHVHLLSFPALEAIGKIKVSEQTAWNVAYIDGGTSLLVGSSDRHLYRVEAKPDAKPESVAKGSDWITQLAVSASGQVAAGEVGGRLHFPSTGGTDSMDAKSGVWTLCWNGDAQLFAGTRKDGIVMAGRSWNWTEPEPIPAEEAKAEDETTDEAESENDASKETDGSDSDQESAEEKTDE